MTYNGNLLQERQWHTKSIEEVSNILQVDINEGLDLAEVKNRQQKHGLNKVSMKKKERPIVLFIRQFSQPLVYILVAALVPTTWLMSLVTA